jgi:hypothetical protein
MGFIGKRQPLTAAGLDGALEHSDRQAGLPAGDELESPYYLALCAKAGLLS